MQIVYLIIFIIIFFITLAALIISGSIIVGLVMAKGVPFVSLPKADWTRMCELAEIKPGDKVYDMGCGKANLLIVANKKFGARAIGYEISLWPYLWGKLMIWLYGAKVELKMKDFMRADISEADVILSYLFPDAMARLEPKFKQELKSGAKVVSYAFYLPQTQPEKIASSYQKFSKITGKPLHTSKIYVYKF